MEKENQELQAQIDELKFIISLGTEIISQLSVDIDSPHAKVCADYSKLCEEKLLSNNPRLIIESEKYPYLAVYFLEQRGNPERTNQ